MKKLENSKDRIAVDIPEISRTPDKVKGGAGEVRKGTDDAEAGGQANLKSVVETASKTFDDLKAQAVQKTDYLTKAIHDEPVKAVVISAVASSVITALLLSMLSDWD